MGGLQVKIHSYSSIMLWVYGLMSGTATLMMQHFHKIGGECRTETMDTQTATQQHVG